ncbi:MAG: toxin-antitoxin system HicB family antitoxin [Streptosporangiales bacterium]|nr:toxin-antitoxin system HicB family antitoxin [Streptosporangiales bacterium]
MALQTSERQALTLRLPPELHEQLRLYAFLTSQSINETVTGVVAEWLKEQGRTAMLDAAAEHGQQTHRIALDKLRDL